jgi:hypothetical protein
MAKVHGTSGSSKYLLKGTNAIGKKLTTLEDINYFHSNYEKILAKTEIIIRQQLDEMILQLGNNEVRLDAQLRESIANRTIEVDGNINAINTKIESTENIFRILGYKMQYWIAISLRERRIYKPVSHVSRELHEVQSRKTDLIENRQSVIKNECKKVIDTQNFITDNITFLLGAQGEESVINSLSQLSDEFHVLNDVNLEFRKAIYWQARDEYIETCQIDHIVVGPTGIFLLETKNWKKTDIDVKFDKLIWQVRRSNLALWYYLKDYYRKGENPKIRSLIVSIQGTDSVKKWDAYIDIVTPYQLGRYISERKRILSEENIHKLIGIIPCIN